MSQKELEVLLGGPEGDYRNCETLGLRQIGRWGKESERRRTWLGNEAFIYVFFDENDRVMGAYCNETWHPREGLIKKITRWLKL